MANSDKYLDIEAIDSLKLDGEASTPEKAAKVEIFAAEISAKIVDEWGEFMDKSVIEESKVFGKRIIWTENDELAVFFNDFDPEIKPETVEPGGVNKKMFFEECGARWYSLTILEKYDYLRYWDDGELDKFNYYGMLVEKYGDDVHKLFFGTLNNPEREEEMLSGISLEDKIQIFGEDYQDLEGINEEYKPDTFGVTYGQSGLTAMKPASEHLESLIQAGVAKLPDNEADRSKTRELYLVAINNSFIAHELTHLFFAAGHKVVVEEEVDVGEV